MNISDSSPTRTIVIDFEGTITEADPLHKISVVIGDPVAVGDEGKRGARLGEAVAGGGASFEYAADAA